MSPGINPGDIKPVAEAVEPLGDNLVVVFHFNNDTKTWSFYSTNPDAADANTLTHMITGETYLIQIKSEPGGHPEPGHPEPDLRGRQLLEPGSLVNQRPGISVPQGRVMNPPLTPGPYN